MVTYNIQDAQGFKLFLRVAWEPFEEEFFKIETRLKAHADVVVNLANVEHQILYKNESQSQDNERRCIHFYDIIN